VILKIKIIFSLLYRLNLPTYQRLWQSVVSNLVLIVANEKQLPTFFLFWACVAPAASPKKKKWPVNCMLAAVFL